MRTLPMQWRSFGVLSLVILCAAGMVYYHLGLFVPRVMEIRAAEGFGNGYSFGADFYPIWLTSHESRLHHSDPYNPELTRQIQIGLFGRTVDARIFGAPPDYWTFAYPAFVDVLFCPLALLPFSVVRIGFAAILATLTAVSVVLWFRAINLRAGSVTFVPVMVLLTLSSYSVLEGIFALQLGLLVGFLLAAALAALVRNRLFLSGGLLALSLIKPQTMLLVAAYLFLWSFDQWRTRWRLVAGFFSVSALLGVSSLLVWPHWIPEWIHAISGYRQHSTPPLARYLLGHQIGSRLGPILILAFLVGAFMLAVRLRHASPASTGFALTVSLLLAITAIALLPGQAVYDHVVLLPGIIFIALSWRSFAASSQIFRVVLGVAALALFWQWMFAPVVIAMQPILSPQPFASALITLPLRTAPSIPFGVFALLGLMMRKEIRKQTAGGGND